MQGLHDRTSWASKHAGSSQLDACRFPTPPVSHDVGCRFFIRKLGRVLGCFFPTRPVFRAVCCRFFIRKLGRVLGDLERQSISEAALLKQASACSDVA